MDVRRPEQSDGEDRDDEVARHGEDAGAAASDGSDPFAENEALRSIGQRARWANLERARRLGVLLGTGADAPLAEAERREAESLAHQIVGSAGTFGYDAASRLAWQVEHELSRIDGGDDRSRTRIRQAVAELVTQLQP